MDGVFLRSFVDLWAVIAESPQAPKRFAIMYLHKPQQGV